MALDPIARRTLQRHAYKLSENIDAKVLLPYLKDVIDRYDIEDIKMERTTFEQNGKLISCVSKGGMETFKYFMRALHLHYRHFASKILKDLKAEGCLQPSTAIVPEQVNEKDKQRKHSQEGLRKTFCLNSDPNIRHLERDILRRHRLRLHSMNTSKIIPLCDSLNDRYHSELINAEKAPFEKAEMFLDTLVKLGPNAFEEFINALQTVNPELGAPILDELNRKKVLVLPS